MRLSFTKQELNSHGEVWLHYTVPDLVYAWLKYNGIWVDPKHLEVTYNPFWHQYEVVAFPGGGVVYSDKESMNKLADAIEAMGVKHGYSMDKTDRSYWRWEYEEIMNVRKAFQVYGVRFFIKAE